MREDGDTSFPGPLFEVNFSQLRVETRALAETQYSLHFTRVQIIASRHPTTVLDSSPNTTPSAENTVKAKEGESSTRGGGITIGQTPSLKFAAATSRQSETEEIQNRSKVAVFLNAQGVSCDRVMQWDYSIDDKREQQCGRTFENPPPPRVKLGFDMPKKPDVEIDLLMYWSTLHKTPTQPSRISRLFSSKGKNRVTCAPAFANLLQQVSISVPLEDLRGSCWFFGPAVEMKTVQPSPDVGLQCKATGQERVRSKGNQVDLKVSFGCALYGQANNRKEITGKFKCSKGVMALLRWCCRCAAAALTAIPVAKRKSGIRCHAAACWLRIHRREPRQESPKIHLRPHCIARMGRLPSAPT